MKKMQLKFSELYYNFIPETYVVPAEYSEFESAFYRKSFNNGIPRNEYEDKGHGTTKRNLWIVKPSGSSRGRGIYIVDDPKQILQTNESLVVSRYIDNPLLLNGHKFDLRIYVLVTSYDPLRIYVYREGLVRFASEKYDISKAFMGPPQTSQQDNPTD
jgi:tubulin polyglutamylase TTLL5